MSLALLLTELGYSPTEVAWSMLRTESTDTIEKVERHDDYQQWAAAYDALVKEGRDPLEYFKEKFHGWAPADLKHLLIQENPSNQDEVNDMPVISDEVASKFWSRNVDPDDIPRGMWGPEGDPRIRRADPDDEMEGGEEKAPEEVPFGPAGDVRVDEEYPDAPAIPPEEVEQKVDKPVDPEAKRALVAQQHDEAHAIDPGGLHEERPPVRNEEQEEREQAEAHEMEMIHRLVLNHPQQALTSWFIKNFGHNYNQLAHDKGHISRDQPHKARVNDIHSLPQDIHDRLVTQSFDAMKQKLREQQWNVRTYTDKHTGDEKKTKGRPNPFLGKVNTEEAQEAAVEALSMAKVSGKSLAEASVRDRYGGGRAVGDLAQTLHHEMLVRQHITGLQGRVDETEEQRGGHGAACPDCQMGHNSIFYHHNKESQIEAGAPAGGGGKYQGAGSYVNPRRLIGTGRITPDFQNMSLTRLKEALEMIEGEPVSYGRGKSKFVLARDLEHYYTNNLLPWNLRRQLDDPHGIGTAEKPGISGVRVPQASRLGSIRKPTQEDIQSMHGPSLYGGAIPAESSGFIFPGEFHSPAMFQFQGGDGAQDWSEMVQSAASPTGQTDTAEFNDWVAQSLAANRQNTPPPVTPAQQGNDFAAITQQMGGPAMYPQSGMPEPMAEPNIQPLPPMQKDAIVPDNVPLSEEQVRAHEHLGQENRITPLNWTGGPTKCTVCAGHGKVGLQRASIYARASDDTGDDVSGMTEQELNTWMMENYRPSGEQGSFHGISERDLEVFSQQTGGKQYDPDAEQDVRFMQGQIQTPVGKDIACPHCDAPHPRMEEGHSAATGVCPTCTGDGRLHHAAGEKEPLFPLGGEETERPSWLKPGPVGQHRAARAEYERYVSELREKTQEKKQRWREKVEPHFTRHLDDSMSAPHQWLSSKFQQDLTDPTPSLSAATGTMFPSHMAHQDRIIERLQEEAAEGQRPRSEGRFQIPSPETVGREDLMGTGGGLMSDVEAAGGLEELDPSTGPSRFTRPDRLLEPPAGHAQRTFGQDVRLPRRQMARLRRMQAAALEGSGRRRLSLTHGTHNVPDEDPAPIESHHGSGKLTKVGPMHMTDLEHLTEFGRPPEGATEWVGEHEEEGIHGEPIISPTMGGPSTGKGTKAKLGRPTTRTVLDDERGRPTTVPRDPKDVARWEELGLLGSGSGRPPRRSGVTSKYANEIGNLMRERKKALSPSETDPEGRRAKALEMADRVEAYMDNPHAPAEENPFSFKTYRVGDNIEEKLLHWDPHTRTMVGQKGASISHLSPFHKKMVELNNSIKLRVEDEWKTNHAKKYGGKGGLIMDDETGGTHQASDSDRAWKNRTEDSERELLYDRTIPESIEHLKSQVQFGEDDTFDVHSMPSAPVGTSPTQQHKEFWLNQMGHLGQMAKNTGDWADYKTDQHHEKRDNWLLKHEPNRLWQAVMRAHKEELSDEVFGDTDESNQWLRDTMHDIWEHHPGWVPYSLTELKEYQQKNNPEPLERAFTSLRISRLMSDLLLQ